MILASIALALVLAGGPVDVIDGDTIRIGRERVRLMGLDAPETWRGQYDCPAERRAGLRSTRALAAILDAAETVAVERHGRDFYGRTLARVFVDGRDVAGMMVSAGMAREWTGHREPWPVCG